MKRRDNQSSAGQSETEAVQTALTSLDWAVARGSAGRIAHNLEVRLKHRRRRVLVGATLLSGALIAGTLVWSPWTRPVARLGAAPPARSSIVVAPRTESLPDGSVVELKPGARFRVEFAPAMRRVVLEAGEAHFAVRKETARPFVVAAGAVEVRAVGTAFAVDYARRSVAVLVTEGRVAVVGHADPQSGGAAERPTELVEAGQRAVVELGDAERGDGSQGSGDGGDGRR
jgi:transmembrane sensor